MKVIWVINDDKLSKVLKTVKSLIVSSLDDWVLFVAIKQNSQ